MIRDDLSGYISGYKTKSNALCEAGKELRKQVRAFGEGEGYIQGGAAKSINAYMLEEEDVLISSICKAAKILKSKHTKLKADFNNDVDSSKTAKIYQASLSSMKTNLTTRYQEMFNIDYDIGTLVTDLVSAYPGHVFSRPKFDSLEKNLIKITGGSWYCGSTFKSEDGIIGKQLAALEELDYAHKEDINLSDFTEICDSIISKLNSLQSTGSLVKNLSTYQAATTNSIGKGKQDGLSQEMGMETNGLDENIGFLEGLSKELLFLKKAPSEWLEKDKELLAELIRRPFREEIIEKVIIEDIESMIEELVDVIRDEVDGDDEFCIVLDNEKITTIFERLDKDADQQACRLLEKLREIIIPIEAAWLNLNRDELRERGPIGLMDGRVADIKVIISRDDDDHSTRLKVIVTPFPDANSDVRPEEIVYEYNIEDPVQLVSDDDIIFSPYPKPGPRPGPLPMPKPEWNEKV